MSLKPMHNAETCNFLVDILPEPLILVIDKAGKILVICLNIYTLMNKKHSHFFNIENLSRLKWQNYRKKRIF